MTPLEQLIMTIANEYDAGMGTTPGMWDILSEVLAEADEKLPESLNLAIAALRDGQAKVIDIRYRNLFHHQRPRINSRPRPPPLFRYRPTAIW